MKKNTKNNDENVQASAIFGIFSSFIVLFSPQYIQPNVNFLLFVWNTYKGAHSNHNRQKKLKETPKNDENYQISRIFQISRQISITKIFKSI